MALIKEEKNIKRKNEDIETKETINARS